MSMTEVVIVKFFVVVVVCVFSVCFKFPNRVFLALVCVCVSRWVSTGPQGAKELLLHAPQSHTGAGPASHADHQTDPGISQQCHNPKASGLFLVCPCSSFLELYKVQCSIQWGQKLEEKIRNIVLLFLSLVGLCVCVVGMGVGGVLCTKVLLI